MLFVRRGLIFEMVKREIATQYAGSWLGTVWAVINPMVMIAVFWFVFGFGLKAKPLSDVPFVIWLTAGMAAWFCFSEILGSATRAITGNPHLVKKILFPTSILAVVKIISSSVGHLIFLVLLLALSVFLNHSLTYYCLQFFYYYLCMAVLVLGLSWITSSANVFFKDTQQVVGLVLRVGFWATPIFWDYHIMPEKVQQILKLNPMFYIVQGYRNSFVYAEPFWDNWQLGIYFWTVSLLIFFSGAVIFRRLKPHFADVI